ncbi:MAG: cytochrome C [Hyphomicrobium sp.]|nr:MAG: cytochrome C [Hyphomicrobium sp.]PPC99812.1 MAG: cytochrome C [Hyphomicrobium sp.]
MSMRSAARLFMSGASLLVSFPSHADPASSAPYLGKPLSAAEITQWDISVFPDGRGLPAGRGTAKDGKALFATHCEQCHGPAGRGATAEELVGEPTPPTAENPNKSIGPYWPHATTIFDFLRRSKPPEKPGSLTADQIYALTAYLLAANKVIDETAEMNAQSLAKVKMPNRDGFIRIDAP